MSTTQETHETLPNEMKDNIKIYYRQRNGKQFVAKIHVLKDLARGYNLLYNEVYHMLRDTLKVKPGGKAVRTKENMAKLKKIKEILCEGMEQKEEELPFDLEALEITDSNTSSDSDKPAAQREKKKDKKKSTVEKAEELFKFDDGYDF